MRNFIAIDFETATQSPDSICEVGICVVRDGEVVDTRSWLVRPPHNRYSYWNMQIHGIRPADTEDAPDFPEVWEEIERTYLDEYDTFVAHNVPFDRKCLQAAAVTHRLHLPYPVVLLACHGSPRLQFPLQQARASVRHARHTSGHTPPRRRRCRDVRPSVPARARRHAVNSFREQKIAPVVMIFESLYIDVCDFD